MLKTEAAVYSHLHFSPVRPPLTSSRLSPTTAATTSTLLRDGVICGDGCRRRNMTPKNRINTPGTSHPMAVSAIAASTRRESEPVHVRDLAATPPNACQLQERILGCLLFIWQNITREQSTRVHVYEDCMHLCFPSCPTIPPLVTTNMITRQLYLESKVDLGPPARGSWEVVGQQA